MKRIYLSAFMGILGLAASAGNAGEGESLYEGEIRHDWENQHVLQINREPARASFTPFRREPGDMSMSLDGAWKFNWTKTPDEQPEDFYRTDFDDSAWKTFPVPGDWEMNGYGTPIYCSSGYTFRIDPPFVMREPKQGYTTFDERNPTGCYRRTFTIPSDWNGKEVYIHFGSVSSAFYIWINGIRWVSTRQHVTSRVPYNPIPKTGHEPYSPAGFQIFGRQLP